jgi:hypothetical protein
MPRVFTARGRLATGSYPIKLAHNPTDAHTKGVKPMPEPWVVTEISNSAVLREFRGAGSGR